MHSAYDDSKIRTYQQIEAPRDNGEDEETLRDDGFETDEDDAAALSIKPSIQKLVEPMLKAKAELKPEDKKDGAKEEWDSFFDIRTLSSGPTREQLTAIVDSLPEDKSERMRQFWILHVENAQKLEAQFRETLSELNRDDKKNASAAFCYRLARHWNQWLIEFEKAVAAEADDGVLDLITRAKAESPETTDDVKRELGKDQEILKPVDLKTRPKGMILADQNVNGDDIASRLSRDHQKTLGFKPLIIHATNLDVERDALIHSFRSPRDDDIRDVPGMVDFLDAGDFANRKFGGIYELEIVLRAMLAAGHRPALKRELPRAPFDQRGDEGSQGHHQVVHPGHLWPCPRSCLHIRSRSVCGEPRVLPPCGRPC